MVPWWQFIQSEIVSNNQVLFLPSMAMRNGHIGVVDYGTVPLIGNE
jgi:hypothetical protein